jgi:hypothetical protein
MISRLIDKPTISRINIPRATVDLTNQQLSGVSPNSGLLDRMDELTGFANAVSQGLNRRCRRLPFGEMRDVREVGEYA